jgi:putative FmdB family regulatory protein
MPLYEYKCETCDNIFDSYVSKATSCSEDQGCKCPACSSLAKRVEISTTSEPVFKGTGFYTTDYKGKKTYSG